MGKRIRTIGGSGGGAPTVTIGPEFGTDIMVEEHHLSSAFRLEASYSLTQEENIRLFEVKSGPYPLNQEQDMAATYLGPPQFRAIATRASTASSTSITCSVPDGSTGELELLLVGNDSGSTFSTAIAGWTFRQEVTNSALGGAAIAAFHRFATAGETTSVTVTYGVGAGGAIASVQRYAFVDTTTPIGAVSGSSGSAADPIAPTVTAPAANSYLVAACAQNNAGAQTYTPPANYAERADLDGFGGVHCTGEVATRIQASSGASGTATMNSNQIGASNYAALHIVINSAQGGSVLT